MNDTFERDVLRLRPFFFEWPVSDTRFDHCCDYMGYALAYSCDMHASPFECPDNEFVYNEVFDEYGAISRNPEGNYTRLRFCPFCGAKLPPSRAANWQRELKSLGFDLFGEMMAQVLDDTGSYTRAWRAIGVPDKYLTAAWRLQG